MTDRARVVTAIQLVQLLVFAAAAGFVAARWGAIGLALTRAVVNLVSVGAVIVIALAVVRRGRSAVGEASAK